MHCNKWEKDKQIKYYSEDVSLFYLKMPDMLLSNMLRASEGSKDFWADLPQPMP